MRILIVTHAPLTSEFGASQLSINLGEALRAHGHDVTLWSPQPLPPNILWWRTIPVMRGRLNEFLKREEPFDVIDCPATLITRLASRSASLIARSTQPDLRYLWSAISRLRGRGIKGLALLPFEYAHTFYQITLVLAGWIQAERIMCLGTHELQWMKRWFPYWREKLTLYFCALSDNDQRFLAEIRSQRKPRTSDGIRFLWIGRWAPHKGTDRLLDFIAQRTVLRPQDTFTIAGCNFDAERNCPPELLYSGTIKIIPSFNRAELYSLLAEHDIGLFTSKVEGWGLVLNEMLEAGMRVFATRAGATEDLQPFFETLSPFPPSIEVENTQQQAEFPCSYYTVFSWSRVAQSYAALFKGASITLE